MKKIALYLVFIVFFSFEGINPALSSDQETALNELKTLADRGAIAAQFSLAEKFAQGDGAPQDYVRAHMWFNLAAALGHKEAAESRELFSQLMTPDQVAEAQVMAREWFAANRGGEK